MPTKLLRTVLLSTALLMCAQFAAHAQSNLQLGIGANYWVAAKHAVSDSFDRNGVGWMLSTRYMATPYFGFGFEIERSPKDYVQFEKPIYCPAGYLIVGKGIYGALGVGTYYYDGDFYEDVFYALRLGFAMELIPHVIFDINANYRADKWSKIRHADDHIKSDNVVLGCAVRVKF